MRRIDGNYKKSSVAFDYKITLIGAISTLCYALRPLPGPLNMG